MTETFWPHKKMGSSKDTERDIRTEICMKKTYMSTPNKIVSARYRETSRGEKKGGKNQKGKIMGRRKNWRHFTL
jgi:hypothetical protein